MPLKEKEVLVDAFSEMAPEYERKVDLELNRFWGWSYESFLEQLFHNTPILPTDTILDVATGTGVISHSLAQGGQSLQPVHALDITFGMLKLTRRRFERSSSIGRGRLVCASAMDMPYQAGAFSLVICGLATHHMHVEKFISESSRILFSSGRLSIIDAGGAASWKIPGIKFLIRLAAYIYFIITESPSRAWAESAGVSHVRTPEEWQALLLAAGFSGIEVKKLHSKYRLIPAPLLIRAIKA